MVGFNNIGYDYPSLHFILDHWQHNLQAADIHAESSRIINTPWSQRFNNHVAPWEVIVPQVDLFLIPHFDNPSKSTSLKALEFKMRSDNVEDLPFPPNTILTHDQMDTVLQYNAHDVRQTGQFLGHCKAALDFRDELTVTMGEDTTNYNDTKIGKRYFIKRLEEHQPGVCYERIGGRNQPRQTWRDEINLSECIFSYIRFQRPEFNRVLDFFKSQTITETKNDLYMVATVYGLDYYFGLGGIHASVESQTVISDDEFMILDLDVTAYYTSLAIENTVYPEHLGKQFCEVYETLKKQRTEHAKGTAPNAMLKLALNGVYGDSNSVWSPFYDPKYTMTITINGQLLLCMLAELLLPVRDLDVIQANTDGLTIRFPRNEIHQIRAATDWWQRLTGLTLEEVEYSRMFIRDVNNYMAEDVRGKVKRKGSYEFELGPSAPNPAEAEWHKDHSALVVPRAACNALLNNEPIREFVLQHRDMYDFLCCTKVPRTSHLLHGQSQVQNTTRYFVSTQGDFLTKVMPPTAAMIQKGNDTPRRISIKAGHRTTICNNIDDFDSSLINYDWYIEEAHKLVRVLR